MFFVVNISFFICLDSGTNYGVYYIITKINNMPIDKIVKEKSKYYPASNKPTKLRNIAADILRSNSNTVEVEFVSGNSNPQENTLKLYPKDSLYIYRRYKKS